MQLEDFVKNQSYFSLGHLPTEQVHPISKNLSELAHQDLDEAIRMVQKIDVEALQVVAENILVVDELRHAIDAALNSGNRLFLSGCGATGRLALTLESLYRKIHAGSAKANQVQALMAGGDFALVKSVENFEDFPEYGARHLLDLGFADGDLLIAITEGGETPYVIGTVEAALTRSQTDPWFVYCNPKALLSGTVERAKVVIENPRVKSLCLPTGPMVLSGSTRLQAASAQMLAVGAALFGSLESIQNFIAVYAALDVASFLKPVIEWESSQYNSGKSVLYETNDFPIAVLTDTTERSPTFSLTPFEKGNATSGNYSLAYLSIPDADDSISAWRKILHRKPIGLTWEAFQGKYDLASILEFDFGKNAKINREKRLFPKTQSVLEVTKTENSILMQSSGLQASLKTPLLNDPLCEQLLIKILLNTLSLLVMGRIGRYEGNVMTWVRASNGKLVDRTLRYLEFLIEKRNLPKVARPELIRKVFEMKDQIAPNEALILKLLDSLKT